jgi:putative tricarboxylic transport membrane protein
MTEAFLTAAAEVFGRLDVWLIVVAAAMYGVFVGAVPGLTATMAVALFVPMAAWLDPVAAIAAIVSMVACAIFAGDIPTALLRIPGTPASAAYADEAYAFVRRGEADLPLGVSLVCSVAGGIFGGVVLMLLGGPLARVATLFSVAESFWLTVLGLTSAVFVSPGPTAKAIVALTLGLLLSTVGLSAVHVEARFTFGQPELYQGISFIPAMIGLFGLSEVLRNLLVGDAGEQAPPAVQEPFLAGIRRTLATGLQVLSTRVGSGLRSGTIGVVVGMLPGAGADIAAWISLAASKRWSMKQPGETVTRADLAGIADATTANNAAVAGSWIPALVFGIPGDSVTAIVIGVLLMKNITPGPKVFVEQQQLVFSIYLIFLLANVILLPVGLVAIRLGSLIVRVPRTILLPVIVLFCVTGAYALNASLFDVGVMLGMGCLGFVLERHGVPLGPVVLGIILGGPLEERSIQAITAAGGSPIGLINRPLAAVLATGCLVLWGLLIRSAWRRREKT